MKRYLSICIILSFLLINTSFSQGKLQLSVGPYFSVKGGVNGGAIIDGRKNGFSFNGIPDFGATCLMMFGNTPNFGATFDLGYSSYSFKIRGVDIPKSFNEKFNYVTLSPCLRFLWFNFGLGIGIPLSGNYGPSISSSQLNNLVEFKIGANYPIMSDSTGSMNVFINAGYMLTGVFKEFGKNDPLAKEIPQVPPQVITDSFNPRVVSISLGFSYLFNFF